MTKDRMRIAASLFALITMLSACGGSGSSGFDGAVSSEAEALLFAMQRDRCVKFEEVEYCESGAEVRVGGERAELELGEAPESVDCAFAAAGQDGPACTATFGFTAEEFPAGTAFLAASGSTIDGPWTISTVDVSTGEEPRDPVGGETEVPVPASGGAGEPRPLVVAVLVYLGGAPVGLPMEAALLADFGADIVYIGSELEVEP